MRFLVLAVAVGTFVATDHVAPVRAPDRPVIVLVHGRGHAGDDTASLRRAWLRDVDSAVALTASGAPRLRDDDVRLAWYADLLDPETAVECTARGSDYAEDGVASLAIGFLSALATSVPRDEAPGARALMGDVLYAVDETRRCAARWRVGEVIESAVATGRPVIVVAYSLGSLIAYEHLASRPDTAGPVSLVTIGSPLAMRDVREILGHGSTPLAIPPTVASWQNVYDPDDVFSSAIDTTSAGTMKIRNHVAEEKATDAHYIRRYLRDRATGQAVVSAWRVAGSW